MLQHGGAKASMQFLIPRSMKALPKRHGDTESWTNEKSDYVYSKLELYSSHD